MKNNILVAFMVCSSVALSQEYDGYQPFEINRIDGTNIGYVTDIVQDTTGKLWIAAAGWEMMSYDGKTLESYHSQGLNRLGTNLKPLSKVTHLSLNTHGHIEFSNTLNSYEFNPYSHEIVDSIICKPDPELLQVFDLISEKNRDVTWSLYFRHSLGFFAWLLKSDAENKYVKVFKYDTGFSPQMIEYQNSIVLAGGKNVLYAVDKQSNEVREYVLKDGDKQVLPYGMAIDEHDVLWVRAVNPANVESLSKAIYYYDQELDSFLIDSTIPIDSLGVHFCINFVGSDLWLGGSSGEIIKLNTDNKSVVKFRDEFEGIFSPSFSSYDIRTVAPDLPVVSSTAGAAIMRPIEKYNFKIPYGEECLNSCPVNAITKLNDLIYFSTGDELYSYDQKLDKVEPISISGITKIDAPTTDTEIDYGANKLTTFKDKIIWNDQIIDLQTNSVIDLLQYGGKELCVNYVTKSGQLWLAPYFETRVDSLIFVYDLDSKNLRTLDTPDSIYFKEQPLQILESQFDDRIWVCFFKQGILEFTKQGEYIRTIPIKNHTNFYYIYETEAGFLWMGIGRGLHRLNLKNASTQKFSNGTTNEHGLAQPSAVLAMELVNDTMLWMATWLGTIECFNLNTKTFVTPKMPPTLRHINYDRGGSVYDEDTKTLFFASKRGLISFRPEDYLTSRTEQCPYDLLITEHASFNNGDTTANYNFSYLSELEEIILDHDHFWFSLKYVLPCYHLNEEIVYSHKLDGFDNEFNVTKQNPYLKYTALPAGEYNLILRAGLREINLDDYTKVINVIVKEAWYKLWWMKALYVILLAGVIYLLVRLKFRQELQKRKAIEKVRTKISMDLHDDVGSLLSGLAMQAELLGAKVGDAHAERIAKITTLSRTAMMQLRDTVWAMDNRKNTWLALVDRINEFGHMSFQDIPVRFILNQNIDQKGSMNPVLRQNIYLILKESLTNVIRHSNATEVNVNITADDKILQLSITDNGSHSSNKSVTGQGLSNMKSRAQQIKGELKIIQDRGFKIQLQIPLL